MSFGFDFGSGAARLLSAPWVLDSFFVLFNTIGICVLLEVLRVISMLSRPRSCAPSSYSIVWYNSYKAQEIKSLSSYQLHGLCTRSLWSHILSVVGMSFTSFDFLNLLNEQTSTSTRDTPSLSSMFLIMFMSVCTIST